VRAEWLGQYLLAVYGQPAPLRHVARHQDDPDARADPANHGCARAPAHVGDDLVGEYDTLSRGVENHAFTVHHQQGRQRTRWDGIGLQRDGRTVAEHQLLSRSLGHEVSTAEVGDGWIRLRR